MDNIRNSRHRAVDLFAGPGGWDVAARSLGENFLGVEFEKNAVATRQADGLDTIHADVRDLDPLAEVFATPGLVASPPCQTFSAAGKGKGRASLSLLESAAGMMEEGEDPSEILEGEDVRTVLVLEPLRWILARHRAGNPYRWVALEQVSTVLPVWEVYAEVLGRLGYSTDTGILSAETFGVPQTRKRAILVASLEGTVSLPAATHSSFYPRDPSRLDPGVLPWVPMASALGITSALEEGQEWASVRPATTVVGSFRPEVIAAPGYRTTVSRQNAPGSITVTLEDAARLQGFPRGFPWSGSKSARFQQVGNAIPPPLAAAILRAALPPR